MKQFAVTEPQMLCRWTIYRHRIKTSVFTFSASATRAGLTIRAAPTNACYTKPDQQYTWSCDVTNWVTLSGSGGGRRHCLREREVSLEGSSTKVGGCAAATSALLVESSGVLETGSSSWMSLITECSADCCRRFLWWNACSEKRR